MTPATTLITHLDDVACSHGANVAWSELIGGVITSGSVMVPCPWFPEVAKDPRTPGLDLGIHLTLTSESTAFRWRPLSSTDRTTGLLDHDGYLWPTVPQLRMHADPAAVDRELRTQLDMALAAGIDVTHVDHHMGAALAPEFVDNTVRMAVDYGLPMLFPSDLGGYLDVLNMGELDAGVLEDARRGAEAAGVAVGDRFVMPLIAQGRTDHQAVFAELLGELPGGVTYLSLHCAAPGEISHIHPNDAEWRIGEYELFRSPSFAAWLADLPVDLAGMRGFRDALRSP